MYIHTLMRTFSNDPDTLIRFENAINEMIKGIYIFLGLGIFPPIPYFICLAYSVDCLSQNIGWLGLMMMAVMFAAITIFRRIQTKNKKILRELSKREWVARTESIHFENKVAFGILIIGTFEYMSLGLTLVLVNLVPSSYFILSLSLFAPIIVILTIRRNLRVNGLRVYHKFQGEIESIANEIVNILNGELTIINRSQSYRTYKIDMSDSDLSVWIFKTPGANGWITVEIRRIRDENLSIAKVIADKIENNVM